MVAFIYLMTGIFYIVSILFLFKRDRKIDITNPLLIFTLYYGATIFVLPGLQIINEDFRYADLYSTETYLKSYVYLNLFIISMVITYLLFYRKIKNENRYNFENWIPLTSFEKNFVRIILLIPITFSVLFYLNIINANGYQSFIANRIILLRGQGYFSVLILIIPVLVAFEFLNIFVSNKTKKIRTSLYIGVLVILSFLPGLLSGSRTNFVLGIILITIIAIFLINKGRLPNFKKIVPYTLIIVSVIVFVAFLQGVRQNIMSGQKIVDNTSFIEKLAGGFGTAENLFWSFENNATYYLMGKSILAVFVGWIPRSIWNDKPYGGAPVFTNTINPGNYNLQGNNITSYTTGLPFEFYMNFGFLGAIIGGFLFAIALIVIGHFRKKIKNSLTFMIWIMLMYCTLMFLHSEIYGATIRFVPFVIPLLVINFILKYLKKKR